MLLVVFILFPNFLYKIIVYGLRFKKNLDPTFYSYKIMINSIITVKKDAKKQKRLYNFLEHFGLKNTHLNVLLFFSL